MAFRECPKRRYISYSRHFPETPSSLGTTDIDADLNSTTDLAPIQTKLRTNASVTMLVNNAGVGGQISR